MKTILRSFIFLFGLSVYAQEYCGASDITSEEYSEKLNLIKAASAKAKSFKTGKLAAGTMRYIPVKPHIFRNSNGTGGLTLDRLNKGLAQVNSYFKDINIEFYFSETTPNYHNDDTFMDGTYTLADEESYQNTYGVSDAINLYNIGTTRLGDKTGSGYAYVAPNLQIINRIYLVNDYFTDDKTSPHEFGHYFGLLHTFHNSNATDVSERELVTRITGVSPRLSANCDSQGDQLCDTPADPRERSSGSASRPENCVYNGTVTDENGDLFDPLVNNIMDYNFCKPYTFTSGQYDRMDSTYDYFLRTGAPFDFSAPVTAQTAPTNVQVTLLDSGVNLGATINWTETSSVESGYFIERSTSETGPFYVIGGVAPNIEVYTDDEMETGETYYYRVKPSNNPTAYSVTSAPIIATGTYCAATVNNPCGVGFSINSFSIKEGDTELLNNSQTGCSDGGYGNFYNTHSATLYAGQEYQFNEWPVVFNNGYRYHYCSVFIDYNGDGDFDDANEKVFEAQNRNSEYFYSENFTVPTNISDNVVRLRVLMNYGNLISNACSTTLSYGEYEDYKIILNAGTLGVEDLQFGNFKIFPNPNYGEKILLKGSKINQIEEVKLYTLDGRQILLKTKLNTDELEIKPSSKLNSGMYIVTLKTNEEIFTKKIIVR